MSQARVRLESRHWLGKTCAGVVLGFGLALALSGLFAWLGPDGIGAGGGKNQFNMWLMAPIWAAVLSFVYLFRDSLRAWLWLGAANVAAFGLLWLTRWVMA
ncbi:hypothetical protein IB227_17030 [Stenotrophomonas sp. STM01]|uniref:hypothetical protein n=1 Tax=Stenotrophomonas sp. STM01 TaxID=2769278 RepID=UPI0017819753|nr:hypothetical protein [Stenotrophomonas sp. STM01]MBD9537556.1 hypothetical protein [Stenotrophomonas sp. STM01]